MQETFLRKMWQDARSAHTCNQRERCIEFQVGSSSSRDAQSTPWAGVPQIDNDANLHLNAEPTMRKGRRMRPACSAD